jgi:hypothetical protein
VDADKQKQLDIVLKYKRIFDSEEGKAVLLDLMEKFHVYGGTYTPDPYNMYFREGERSVVRHIISAVDMDYEAFRKTLKEIEEEF